ncbi:dihydroorotate dehydrogenase electron transfer subunit [Vallitalea okinawensis]|uniref:dihydroorotate dehydrogenase electron transfer subunit n=1 Tax=Vallitalea okinawensis TaxID=2078660 RepID=UPI000CFD8778|nr:dihydroorotate dehydrogenase electron transfer subunit [Vallitalea okinawensis]
MCKSVNKTREIVKVQTQEEIAKDIYRIIIEAPHVAKEAKAGQFVNLYCQDGEKLLPRPISICEINKDEGIITLVYAVVGSGTKAFSQIKKGDTVSILGPLGNGFPMDSDEGINIIVGGGVGTPPLLQLVKELKGDNHVFLGFRSEPYLIQELKKYATVHVATDDGQVGYKGSAIDLLKESKIKGNRVYGCGPKPMLRALQEWALENNIEGYLSLEERMGCGFGACVGCVCKIKRDKGIQHKRVCHDGPVFTVQEVIFDA